MLLVRRSRARLKVGRVGQQRKEAHVAKLERKIPTPQVSIGQDPDTRVWRIEVFVGQCKTMPSPALRGVAQRIVGLLGLRGYGVQAWTESASGSFTRTRA